MARFYRTSSANPLDYMYKMNIPLMEKVIGTNDQYITDTLNQTGKLNDLADTFPYLEADEDRAREIANGYSKKIDDVTSAIKADPANWRSQIDPIQDVSRDLLNNYKTGEISKITGNYNKYKEVSDYIDKQNEEYAKTGKGISADRGRAYKQYFLSNFTKANPKGTSYDPKTGDYNSLESFNPMSNIDIRKELSEGLDKMKADGEIRVTDNLTGAGEYFNKETNKWEGITPDRILRIVTDRINNPQIMDYLKQDTQAGIINGVYDTDQKSQNYGKFINPYNYSNVSLSSGEQQTINSLKSQIDGTKNVNLKQQLQKQLDTYTSTLSQRKQLNWNDNSYLAPIMRGVVDEYSYSKTDQSNDLKPNSIWSTQFSQGQQNNRDALNRKSKEDMQQKLLDNQKQMQTDRLQANKDLKLIELNSKLNKGKTTVTSPDSNTVIGQHYTTPFYYLTKDKDKMTESLNDEINTYSNTNDQLQKALADIQKDNPDNKLMISNAQNQIANNEAMLNSLQARRDDAVNYAISKWKAKGDNANIPYIPDMPSQEKTLRSYLSGVSRKAYDDANTEFSKIEIQKNNMEKGTKEYGDFFRTQYLPAKTRKDQIAAEYLGGQSIFNSEIKDNANDKLSKAAKETTNRSDVVAVTQPQVDQLVKMINSIPSGYKIMDTDGRETNLSFEHGTATTDPSKFKINGVSTTTGIGNKQVDILANINGKNVIITPKDNGGRTTSFLSQEFRKSKDENVNNIGRILGSPTASILSDIMTEVKMNTNSTYGTKDAWVYRDIPNPANPNETLSIRARSIATDDKPKWEFQFKTSNPKLIMQGKSKEYELNGNKISGYVPLTSSKSPSGEYHNLSDILSIFPADM